MADFESGFLAHLPGMPEAINADSFDEDVLQSPVPVLVEFWASRCGPCRRMAPEMASAASVVGKAARFYTVNVDEEMPAAERFGVHSIPATLLFVHGREVARHVGFMDGPSLVHLLRLHQTSTEREN